MYTCNSTQRDALQAVSLKRSILQYLAISIHAVPAALCSLTMLQALTRAHGYPNSVDPHGCATCGREGGGTHCRGHSSRRHC